MKREIKFRAFISGQIFKSDNGMVYMDGEIEEDGYFCTGNSVYKSYYDREDGATCKYKVDAEIMQFLGVQDKNDKDIYEGDVIDTCPMISIDSPTKHEYLFEVKFGVAILNDTQTQYVGFYLENESEKVSFCHCLSSDYEIIGNIHENPSLLQS